MYESGILPVPITSKYEKEIESEFSFVREGSNAVLCDEAAFRTDMNQWI
jgi:hypothetical protein